MAGYSTDEIEAAVTKFVKSTIKTKRDPLGPVDMGSAFGDVIQLFSSTLLFDPNAIFYVIYLATNKLNVSVTQALEYIADLETAVNEVTKKTKEVTNQDLLGDASAALLEVDSILTTNQAISNPAFERYKTALNNFTTKDLAPNIRTGTDIVRPPPLARSDSFSNLQLLDALYADILTNLAQVRLMLSEFNTLNLAVLTIQSTVRQARYDLDDLQTYFNSSVTAAEKIAKCREAYLRLTSGKAVLTNLTTVTDPQSPRMSSTATSLAQAAAAVSPGEMTGASVTCTRSAPWAITSGVNDQLSIKEDDALAPTVYTLVPPEYPSVETSIYGTIPVASFDIVPAQYGEIVATNAAPYTIVGGNDWLVIHVTDANGVSQEYNGQLTAGVYATVADLITEITAKVKLNGVGPSISTVTSLHGTSWLNIQQLLAGDDRSITVGQKISGWGVIDANAAIGLTPGAVGAGRYASNGFQLDGGNVATLPTLPNATTLAAFMTSYNHGTYPPGTYDGQVITRTVNGTPRDFVRIRKKVSGATSLRITAPTGADRDRTLRAYAALGLYEGETDTSAGMSAAEVASVLNAGGKVSATTVLTNFASGETGIIKSVTAMDVPTGAFDTAIDHVGDQLLLKTGENSGYHRITAVVVGGGGISIAVDPATPFTYSGSWIPDQSWSIVRELMQVDSLKTDLTSQLTFNAASANATLGFTAGATYGTTTGFKVYDSATGKFQSFSQADVVQKDIVARYTPTKVTHTVSYVSADGLQLELTPPLPNNLTGMQFDITSAAAMAFSGFYTEMAVWDGLLAASNYKTDISELMRVMNPILYNARPTQAQRTDALAALTELGDLLDALSGALVSFVVAPVPRIDAALKMLQERALDRAYDMILSGYVAQFFDMDMDDASRSAYMLKTMRVTVQNDLPQSRVDEFGDDTSLSQSWEDSDPNYDVSDRDQDENVAILGEVAEYPDYDTESPRKRF